MNEVVPRNLRPPIGLLVSTGAPKPDRGPGRAQGWFRFKDGADGKLAANAAKARDEYGEQPDRLDDVLLLASAIHEVLDIRIVAWGKSRRKIIGRTNFAELTPDAYKLKVDAWDDEVLYRPRELKEVPERLRADWQGEPIPARLEGPDDPRIAKLEMHVEATFRFTLPRVLGMGEVALYSTRSKHNRDQLYAGVTDAFTWFQGNPRGVPFTFKVRPRRTEYFDRGDRAWKPSNTFEVVFSSPWTWTEAIEAIGEQRAVLGSAPLALPAGRVEPSELFADNPDREIDDATDVPFVPVEVFEPEDEPREGDDVLAAATGETE